MLTPTNRHPARHRAQLTASDVSVMRGVTPVLNHVDLVVTPASRVAIPVTRDEVQRPSRHPQDSRPLSVGDVGL